MIEICEACAMGESCVTHDPRPPGEPPAEALADHLADVVIVDGPRDGEVWTYEADHGGYLPADPALRMKEKFPIDDIGALIAHTQCTTVRPIPKEEDR